MYLHQICVVQCLYTKVDEFEENTIICRNIKLENTLIWMDREKRKDSPDPSVVFRI